MDCQTNIDYFNKKATEYEDIARRGAFYAPEVDFVLMHEFVKKKTKLLDLCIGTGFASEPFYEAGVKIFGIDGSEEMLKICKKKKIAEELTLFNLCDAPFPYDAEMFDYVIFNSAHFFGDLDHFFSEASRLLKKGGLFSIDIEKLRDKDSESDYQETTYPADHGTAIQYKHRESYIDNLLKKHNFEPIKNMEYVAYPSKLLKEYVYFKNYILRKSK